MSPEAGHGPPLVVSWTPHERARRLAQALGGVYLVPGGGSPSRPVAARYALQAIRTVSAVIRRRPAAVVYTNPPFVSGLVLVGLRALVPFRLWSDTHSGAVNDPRWARFRRVNELVLRLGDGMVLAHPSLASLLNAPGVEDCVVNLPGAVDRGVRRPGGAYLVAAVSYSFDEPVREVLEALHGLPELTVMFTGDAPAHITEGAPENARFTGWLERSEYDALLAGSKGIICLTDRESTMQMGAYEGAELGIPLLLSDRPVLRQYFADGGAVFVPDHRPGTIARGLQALARDSESLHEGAERMRRRLLAESSIEVERLRRLLGLSG